MLIVTAAAKVEARVRGLDAGADDYVAKPFVFAGARRSADRGSRARTRHPRFSSSGHEIALSAKEYALLEFLMRNAGQPVSRAAIVEQVWKFGLDTMANVVDVYINHLRREVDFGHDRPLIRTIRGVGYQIGEDSQPS